MDPQQSHEPGSRAESGRSESSPAGTAPESMGTARSTVAVTVIRTGGFAGLRREWRAEADEREASHWVSLIEECPWDAVAIGVGTRGADLFVWRLDARFGDRRHAAELADPDVQGPWRTLIDAVRDAGAPSDQPRQ